MSLIQKVQRAIRDDQQTELIRQVGQKRVAAIHCEIAELGLLFPCEGAIAHILNLVQLDFVFDITRVSKAVDRMHCEISHLHQASVRKVEAGHVTDYR